MWPSLVNQNYTYNCNLLFSMGGKADLSHEGKNTDWRCFRTGCFGEYLDLRGMKWQEGGENCIMRSSIICTLHQILLGAAVAQAVWCLTMGWTIGVRSPTGAEDVSSSPFVQTGSEAHPASYLIGSGDPFPGGKARPGRDADHSPQSSAEAKYE
jgi:hypothetical protein